MIKRNQPEVENTDFEIKQNKGSITSCFLLLHPSVAHISGTNHQIIREFSAKCSFAYSVYNQVEHWNWFKWLQTDFAWSHHIQQQVSL